MSRPPTGVVQIKRTVCLDDATVEKLREYGDGYLSVGIRRAAAAISLPGHDGVRKGVD